MTHALMSLYAVGLLTVGAFLALCLADWLRETLVRRWRVRRDLNRAWREMEAALEEEKEGEPLWL